MEVVLFYTLAHDLSEHCLQLICTYRIDWATRLLSTFNMWNVILMRVQKLIILTFSSGYIAFHFCRSFTQNKTHTKKTLIPWTWSQLPQLHSWCLCNKSTQFFSAVVNKRKYTTVPNEMNMKGFKLIYLPHINLNILTLSFWFWYLIQFRLQ